MVLYMLKCSGIKLTVTDISDYIVIKGYTDALTLQATINDLVADGFITLEKKHNRSYLDLTAEGLETANSLESRLAKDIRSSIYNYIAVNKNNIIDSHSIQTKITETDDGRFMCELTCNGKKGILYSTTLIFPSESLAKDACDKFNSSSTDIYRYMLDKLT